MPIITVQFIQDVVATSEQKRELIVGLTDTFVRILGDVVRPFVYCIIQETPQAEWGIAGVPMPDLVYLTSDKHAKVIDKSNTMMRAAIAQMAAAQTEAGRDKDERADALWRGGSSTPANGTAVSNQTPFGAAEKERVMRNREVIHRFYRAVNAKQRDEFYKIVHPNFVNHGGASGDIVGPKALVDSLDPFYQAMPDWHVSEDYVVAEGDRVASRGTITGTHTGSFMGIPPTGKKLSWTGIIIYRLDENGMVVERWQDFDAVGMLTQMGAIPAMG